MKGILIEPGKAPVVTALPDTLQGIEALLQCPCEQKVLPRTPAGWIALQVARSWWTDRIFSP